MRIRCGARSPAIGRSPPRWCLRAPQNSLPSGEFCGVAGGWARASRLFIDKRKSTIDAPSLAFNTLRDAIAISVSITSFDQRPMRFIVILLPCFLVVLGLG